MSDIPQLPDGVYLGLDEEQYFGQRGRLGSTDLVTLFQRRHGWWWSSKNNPFYRERDRSGLTFGTALHKILLEGEAAYNGRYLIEPQKADYDGLIDSIPDIKAALEKAGWDTTGKSSWKKEDWVDEARRRLPDVHIWSEIQARFRERLGDPAVMIPISAEEDFVVRFMHEVATDPRRNDNDDVRKLFSPDGHPPLAEVTVFFTEDGVGRRARFDRLYPGFVLDLKSLQNVGNRDLRYYCGELIARRGYDVQRADHHVAFEHAARMIREGQLYGGTPEQRTWIGAIADARGDEDLTRAPDYVWLFYQKPDASAGVAPVLFPVLDETHPIGSSGGRQPGDRYRTGLAKRDAALRLYKASMAAFGPDEPWAKVEPLHYTDESFDGVPRVFFPHWIDNLDPNLTETINDDQQ